MIRIVTLLAFYVVSIFPALSQEKELKIYVSDAAGFQTGPWKIIRYDADGTNPKIFTSSQLGWPQDILFLEDEGVALISNFTTGNIARYDAISGDFIDFFATQLAEPTRMKIGPDGLLYVLQWSGTFKVLRFQLDGTALGEFTATGVEKSIGLDWDTDQNLYVSSYSLNSVRKFDKDGKDLGDFVKGNLAGPTNIWFEDTGNLIVFSYNNGVVVKFDENGANPQSFITGLSSPEGVDFLDNGDFLIGNGGDGSVKQYTKDGSFVADLVIPGLGGLQTPNAVVLRMEENFRPEISDQAFEIDEEPDLSDFIGLVVADDPNKDRLEFTIIEGNDNDVVSIGRTSGRLIVNNPGFFDFETNTSLLLRVEVSDKKLRDTANISITINDINENALATSNIKPGVIFPNPAFDYIDVGSEENIQFAALVGMDGRIRQLHEIVDHRILLHDVSAGIYVIDIELTSGEMVRERLIVQ